MRSCQVIGCPQPALPQRTVIDDEQVELEVAVCPGHVLNDQLRSDRQVVPGDLEVEIPQDSLAPYGREN